MFLTVDILKQKKACDKGIAWFNRHFPNGGELIDVIRHQYVTPEILHWGFNCLTTTKEEQDAYWEKLNIDSLARWSIYECYNITGSEYVTRSSFVENSQYIFSCKSVTDSNNISSSDNVERSRQIFGSEFVYDSARVIFGKNITESLNVVNSDYVVRSSSIMNAAVITNSHYISSLHTGGAKRIENSAFISECSNLKNCLFCFRKDSGEYLLFNEPIGPAQFEIIMRQLKNILSGWQSNLIQGEWSENTIPLDTPQIERNVICQYQNLPDVFWRWVTTLPNYDPAILYSITFQSRLLQ